MSALAQPEPHPRGLRSGAVEVGALHLVLNNTLEAIEDGRVAIERFLAPHDFSMKATNRLEVIFEEVIANIVRHGFHPGSDQSITVMVSLEPGAARIIFEDDGTPFDPLGVAAPKPFTTLEDAAIGGQGIVLLRRLSSSVRYEAPAAAEGGAGFQPANRLIVTVETP